MTTSLLINPGAAATGGLETMTEVWKPIPSLPEYQASNMGHIKRNAWIGKMPYGGVRQYGGQPTAGVWVEKNRRYVTNYKGKNYKIARLVCEAFHGPAPAGKSVCMHLDENSKNNRPENLGWGTQKENLNAPGFIAYCKARTGENSPTIKGRNGPYV